MIIGLGIGLPFSRQVSQSLSGLIISAIESDGGTVYSKSCLTTSINNNTDQGQMRLTLDLIAAIEADSGTVLSRSCTYTLIDNNTL